MNIMSTEVARAFLMRTLDSEQVNLIRAAEASFRPTECLGAQQILSALDLRVEKLIAPEEAAAMENLWNKFRREVLWKQQQIEIARHPEGCTMFTCRHPWNPLDKTKAQEMHQWEDYAMFHYKTPQVAGKNLAETLG